MSSGEAPRRRARAAALALWAGLALGCGGTAEDLFPSSRDRRPPVVAGTEGPGVGQLAPDFTRTDTLGNEVALHDVLAGAPGAIVYFAMWCPICDAHMSHLVSTVAPAFPDVPILVVDYVSGSVAQARAAQVQMGWDVSAFRVLADPGAGLERFYGAGMGIVVIGRDRVVRMNGEYDWGQLQAALAGLP